MSRPVFAVLLLAAVSVSACRAGASAEAPPAEVAAVPVAAVAVVEEPIERFVQVTGTLTAEDAADVAAEIAGRIVATPIERGRAVSAGAELIRIAAVEAEAQAREVEANAAQIAARLGLAPGKTFDVAAVPEVASALASRGLARTEFARARTLHAGGMLAQAELDQRAAQLESAERQYDVARNAAEQQYQSLLAAQARVTVARKAVADTVVRAPFAGVVGERFVSVGDYVTPGTKVASVLRVDPLRVELTVPEQYLSAVGAGRPVTLQVDAYPGETFTGQVRYVSPAVTAETRALVVEAVVPNRDGRLKPGLFASARLAHAAAAPALLVPAAAVRTVAGTARVFVVDGDRVEERIVMPGERAGDRIEITDGVTAGERVAASGVAALADGVRVAVR